MHVTIITGSRYNDVPQERVTQRLDELLEKHGSDGLLVFHGGASGVDKEARLWCEDNGVQYIVVPAMWGVVGPSAGPKRNRIMCSVALRYATLGSLSGGNDTLALEAFPGPKSRGTYNCINEAKRLGITANVWR